MTRMPRLRPDELSPAARALYDEITGGPRARTHQSFRLVDENGRLEGPFNAMLFSPHVGHRLQALGAALRYETDLTPRAREIAILAVAAHWNSEFERYAHEHVGRDAGLSEDELAAIRDGLAPEFPDPYEDAVFRTARALAVRGDLDDEEYSAVVSTIGHAGIFELSTLIGYYAALALQLRVFRVRAPVDR